MSIKTMIFDDVSEFVKKLINTGNCASIIHIL